MANQEQIDILKQDVQVWNQWRVEHPDVQIDLSSANLSYANLSSAKLSSANLSYANLSYAELIDTDLSYANLSYAELSYADFFAANLSNVDLCTTILNGTVFYSSNLSNVDLSGAALSNVVFGYIDLSTAKGLEMVSHFAPSTIGIDTIYRSQGKIPESFLKKAGVPDSFIDYMRSLVGKPIDYYSCFISYSSKDDAFAKRLYADLQSNHVRCWFAPEDLKIGDRIRTGIDEAIRVHDKLLLILSKSSVASGWVEREVKTALAKERKEKRTILLPVRVDKAVFESPFDWATEIRHERNIGDFTRWKDHDEYQKVFARLLRDLQAQ